MEMACLCPSVFQQKVYRNTPARSQLTRLAAVVAADWAKSSAELGPVACARARAVLAALLPAELRNIWL